MNKWVDITERKTNKHGSTNKVDIVSSKSKRRKKKKVDLHWSEEEQRKKESKLELDTPHSCSIMQENSRSGLIIKFVFVVFASYIGGKQRGST